MRCIVFPGLASSILRCFPGIAGSGVIVLSLLTATAAHASSVTVPDDFSTIQSAYASGADTVFIRDGDYPESVATGNPVVLMALTTDSYWGPQLGLPRIGGLSANNSVSLIGLSFSEPVQISHSGEPIIERCRLGAGVTIQASRGHMWNCIVFGDLDADEWLAPDIAMNTIIGGTLISNPAGDHYLRDNVVIGPAPIGIHAYSDAYALRNYVRGCDIGIRVGGTPGGAIKNTVEDCGVGIEGGGSFVCEDNTVRRSQQAGIDLYIPGSASVLSARRNVVEGAGQAGIRVHGPIFSRGAVETNTVHDAGDAGIVVDGLKNVELRDNVVLRSAADGIWLGGTAVRIVERNIVGRSQAGGVTVAAGSGVYRGNTAYLNAGAGLDITGAVGDSIDHNISHGNDVGLAWNGGIPVLGCNDWSANPGGATVGVAPGLTDLQVNPMFCDLAGDDVSLSAVSPVLNAPGCGLIGALGEGCAVPAAVLVNPAGLGGGLVVRPVPARGGVDFAWSPEQGVVRVEVFDLQGARRWSGTVDGNAGWLHWGGVDSGGMALPSGVYFVRLAGKTVSEARLVLTR